MVDDDVQDAGAEDFLAPPGPRRSTFTPPPRDPESIENAARVFNDDEIAAALAAQLGGSVPPQLPVEPVELDSTQRQAPPETPRVYDLSDDGPVDAADSEEYARQNGGDQLPPPIAPAAADPNAYLYLGAPPPTAPALDAPPPPGYELTAGPQEPNDEAAAPPADNAQAFDPQAFEPPAFDAPAFEPSAFDAPAFEPPAFDAPAFDPPAFDPPAFEPPAFEPPVDDAPAYPPAVDLPPFEPPAVDVPPFEPNLPAFERPAGNEPTMPPTAEQHEASFDESAGTGGEESAALPPSPGARPERQSLADDELLLSLQAAASSPGATLDVIEQLQNQLLLREEEAQAFRDWESSMLSLGTPDAIAAVEEARSGFAEVVPPATEPDAQEDVSPSAPRASSDPPELVEPPQSLSASPEFTPTTDTDLARLDTSDSVALPVADDAPTTGALDLDAFLRAPDTGQGVVVDFSTAGVPSSELVADGSPAGTGAELTAAVPAELLSQPVPVARRKGPSAFVPEESGPEPTATDQRVGRAARMFWMWFAANSSLVSVAFGAIVFMLGMSLRQSIVAVLAGVALSFIPLGLGTLAGKRSGQPTMIVSRATFGIVGNVLPALIALGSRLFWGAALLWILGAGVASILVGAQQTAGFTGQQLTLIAMAGGFLLALVIAFLGYGMIARVQLVVSVVSGILIVGFIVLTWSYVDIPAALTVADGSWLLAITGAVLVFSFVGLVWANSSADLARYQRPSSSGGGSMLWATFGAGVPSFVLIAYGALLAASNPQIASALLTEPVDTLGRMLPLWYPVPLLIGTAFSLISGVVISIYSAGFALQSVGLRVHRDVASVLVGVLLAAIAATLMITGVDFSALFRDFATTLAVPVAAWAGIFASEIMIRNRRFEARSLLSRGGIYPNVRWVNLAMLVVISAIGCGLISASVDWLGWQGYLFPLLGVPVTSDLAVTDVGVLVALVLGLLTPIVAGIPAIRRQEKATAAAE